MFFKTTEVNMEMRDTQQQEPSTEPLLPSLGNTNAFDCVLVAHKLDADDNFLRAQKQRDFILQLEKKKMTVTKVEHEDKVFYGIRAPKEIFEDYNYLLKVSDSCNSGDMKSSVTQATRIRITDFILKQTFLNTGEALDDLLSDAVFETMFCLHERRTQKMLRKTWARWLRVLKLTGQPMSDVRSYFGEKVALYYLWLGWYTKMLMPAAALGVIVFLYGVFFFNSSPMIKEVCESNIIMCPRCDKMCGVWNLSTTCTYAKVSHLFDNEGTVAFSMFMAIWATLFLELWKRHRARHVSKWQVYDWCEEEEELILEIVNDMDCQPKQFRHSYLRSALVLILVTLMLMLIIGLAHALVVFRVVAAPMLAEANWPIFRGYVSTVVMILGAVLHYITIQVMTRVNRLVALKLCNIEKTRSRTATERSFTVKMFTFQFFTLFSSLFYVAFFLGRINGRPGSYLRIAGWRLEECHPSGCLTDLFIQMAVIMMLKQTLNNVFEFTVPWMKRLVRTRTAKKLQRKCGYCYRQTCREKTGGREPCDICKLRDWLRNYHLTKTDAFSLFNEFLEMVVQFSFTTIFVAAFPLAPLLALINNLFEIRLDAIKMVSLEQRLVPRKTNDIGIWTKVLEAIGVLAVIANGLVIGVTSDFIPRLVYRYHYGPCATGLARTNCMQGYINDTLSVASTTHPDVEKDFTLMQMFVDIDVNNTECRYRDYRTADDYTPTSQFWFVLAVRFAFVILFEHVVVVCKFVAAWFVPNCPTQVKNDRLGDKLTRLKEELRERKREKSTDV